MSAGAEKLAALRALMRMKKVDAYIIPLSDPHMGEYIPDHWNIVQWLTGFTGSAATVVITDSFAGLWTDSRYFSQAERQLAGSGFEFVRPVMYQQNDYIDFLWKNIGEGGIIAFDGRIFPVSRFRILESKLKAGKISIITDCDLITEIWDDRPALPSSTAFSHPIEFSGKESLWKIREIREQIKSKGADYQIVTAPDEMMWTLNIRGHDIDYSPVLLSFALIGQDQLLLFIDEEKIPKKNAGEFDSLGIVVLPYEEAGPVISYVTQGSTVLLNPSYMPVAMYNSISTDTAIVEDITIPCSLKAIKNKTEIENICRVMVRDGVAVTRFFHWLEQNISRIPLYESVLAEKLLEERSRQEDFIGLSFPTIAAFGPNSALPHYQPFEGSGDRITGKGILLIDSGGQYVGGTTDLTRTIAVGDPDPEQIRDFTLVLKGHINLALAKFPSGTRGYQLDLLARRAMWGSGMNYSHGTGHGVGYCLNVHEGPQSISPADNKTIIEPGMLSSNEPAIYREGEYGIRTENLILCYEDEETEFGSFLRFDTVSLCYIDKKLVDSSLLEPKEIEWLNSYHSDVYMKLAPFLTDEERIWLKDKTGEIA